MHVLDKVTVPCAGAVLQGKKRTGRRIGGPEFGSMRDYWSPPNVFSTAVMFPKSPSCSSFRPAAKYRAVAEPDAPPLPNEIPQRPLIAIGALLASIRLPLRAPVTGSNARIIPLPN